MAKTISISSGKGGVGKTFLTANLAFELAKQGKRVLLLDGDLGMANLDIAFSVKPKGNLLDILNGHMQIQDILTPLGPQMALISGGSGLVELNRLSHFERRALVDAVSSLDQQFDYLLIDTAPGISDNVLHLNSAAQMTALVITPDPSSLTDSYALMKVLNQEYRDSHFAVICNQVRDVAEGAAVFQKFSDVAHRFLNISLDYWGSIPMDSLIRKSQQQQRLVAKFEPNSAAAGLVRSVGKNLHSSLQHIRPKTGIQFFWEQVVGVA